MKKSKRKEALLLLGLILAVFLMNLPTAYTHFYHDITGKPQAVKGSMDLSFDSLREDKLYLDGQWEFFWHRFIATESQQAVPADRLMDVPDSWSNYSIEEKPLTAGGWGSYRLTLTGVAYDKPVIAYIPDFSAAYRVFLDGQLAAESGTLSKNMDEIFTVPKAQLYPVMLAGGTTHQLVIETATTRFSGLYMTPILGDYQRIMDQNQFRNELRLILFGIVLFSFFILIAIYTLSIRRKFYSLWMPVMIFFILLRIMLTSEFYSVWQPVLFFNLPYEATNELMYFTTFALKYLLIFLVQEQCGILFTKGEKAGFLIYYTLLYLIYLFVPQNIYNDKLSVIVPMLTYALDAYLFIKVYRGRQQLKKFGLVVFWGAALVISGLTIDSYYLNGKIFMNMSLALLLTFTVFALIMCWVYSMRTGDLYDDFTRSALQLELANNQLAAQKEYYDTLRGQMNEIREIKHDIRHFVGAMSRLADEGKLEELRAFVGEYSEKTEMDQLPVFCENVVANSIIGYYYMRARESGISFESRGNIGRELAISDSDLCIVLGNALENAVEACRQMDAPEAGFVSVEAARIKGQILLKVSNTYNGKLQLQEGRCISTKGGKSTGLGIRNIEKVMELYRGFVKIEHTDKEFTLMAAFPEK